MNKWERTAFVIHNVIDFPYCPKFGYPEIRVPFPIYKYMCFAYRLKYTNTQLENFKQVISNNNNSKYGYILVLPSTRNYIIEALYKFVHRHHHHHRYLYLNPSYRIRLFCTQNLCLWRIIERWWQIV